MAWDEMRRDSWCGNEEAERLRPERRFEFTERNANPFIYNVSLLMILSPRGESKLINDFICPLPSCPPFVRQPNEFKHFSEFTPPQPTFRPARHPMQSRLSYLGQGRAGQGRGKDRTSQLWKTCTFRLFVTKFIVPVIRTVSYHAVQ